MFKIIMLFLTIISSFLLIIPSPVNAIINAETVSENCLTTTWDKNLLIQLKDNKFKLQGQQNSQHNLAKQLLNCLAHPNPTLRDTIAFGALSQWLRADKFTTELYLFMFNKLTTTLSTPVNDPHGVYLPFTALMLAEVARVDRKKDFLTPSQRSKLVNIACDYLSQVRDYRGFDRQVGWRHGIAHGADLILQLALNPAINKKQLDQMLAALSNQIVAHNNHHYIYGEPKRLATPVVYIFLRGLHNNNQWTQWLKPIASAKPFDTWAQTYQSEQGLAKRFNSQNFLFTIYAMIKPSNNEILKEMIPALELSIKKVN